MKSIIYQEKIKVSVEEFLSTVKSIDRLRTISKPVVVYDYIGDDQPHVFEEGKTYTFKAKFLNFIPLGEYKIEVVRADDMHFYTRSHFGMVKEYKRWIDIKQLSDNQILCTHQLEYDAGWKNPLVYLGIMLFQYSSKRRWVAYVKEKEKREKEGACS